MYATAQRVRSERATGINVLVYRHDPGATERLQPDQVVEQLPGTLESARITMPPGGNAVLSYLDVVAPETVAQMDVAEAVVQLKPDALGGSWVRSGEVAVRFARLAGGAANISREYDELATPLAELLRARRPLPWAGGEGVTIRGVVSDENYIFQLEPRSEALLRAANGPDWKPPTVSVGHVTMDDLRISGVDTWVEIAKVLTGAPPEELLRYGPVRFITTDGRALWSWPATTGVGYCLSCHRQHTLAPEGTGFRCTNCNTFQPGDGRFVSALT